MAVAKKSRQMVKKTAQTIKSAVITDFVYRVFLITLYIAH